MAEFYVYNSRCAEETASLGQKLASLLSGGEILFFKGPIGAGKTVMVKAVARYFGFKKEPASASFSLMKRYKNKRGTLYHADLFRLESGEMYNLGFEEMLEDEDGILLIEWPAAAEEFFPKDRLEIEVVLKGGNDREIKFRACGKRSGALLGDLCELIKREKK